MVKKVVSKIVSSMEKVFPEIEPANEQYFGNMLKDERYNFQIVYFNGLEYSLVKNRIEVRGELAPYITISNIDFAPGTVLPTKYIMDDYYLRHTVGLYPDILRPFGVMGLAIPSCQWRSVWVSVYNPKGLKAGLYTTEFILKDEKDEVLDVLKYDLEVIDEVLGDNDLKLTNWMHYDCICQWHNVAPFSKEFYDIFEKYLEIYVELGFNMLLTPIFTLALDTMVGGERFTTQLVDINFDGKENYEFSFDKLDEFINYVRARGINYIEFSHLFTQWGGKFCPKVMANVNGEYKKIFGWETKSDSKEYVEFLRQFLTAIVKYIDNKGIRDICHFHLTDEPFLADMPQYRICRENVKKYIGDMPTIDATMVKEYVKEGLVDIIVPILHAHKDFAEGNPKEMFLYYCTPKSGYFTNRTINMPSLRTRILGVQLYDVKVQGFLHWGYNFYNSVLCETLIDPYTDTSCGGGIYSGDAYIVYPHKNGVYRSLRSEMVMAGFQDYRALKTLEKYVGREKTLEFLHENGIEWLDVYPRNSGTFDKIRRSLNDMIKVAQKGGAK